MNVEAETLVKAEKKMPEDYSDFFSRSEDGGFRNLPKESVIEEDVFRSSYLSEAERKNNVKLSLTTGNEIYKNPKNKESLVFVGKAFAESSNQYEDATWYALGNLVAKLSIRLEKKTARKQTPSTAVLMKDMLGITDDAVIYNFDAPSANENDRTVPSSLTIKGGNAFGFARSIIGNSEKYFAFFNALRESNKHLYREMDENEKKKYTVETIGYMQAVGLAAGALNCTSVKVGCHIMTSDGKIYTRK